MMVSQFFTFIMDGKIDRTLQKLIILAVFGVFWGNTSITAQAAGSLMSFALTRTVDDSGDQPIVAYSFVAGERRFLFCPPSQWKITGEASEMSFSTAKENSANAIFHISPPEDIAVVSAGTDDIKIAALTSKLPRGYTDLKILSKPRLDALPIYNFQSIEMEFQYTFFGRNLKSSVIICKMGEAIGFTAVATAGEKDYAEFSRQYHTILNSFQLIPLQAKNIDSGLK